MMKGLLQSFGVSTAGLAQVGRQELEKLKELRQHHAEGTEMRAFIDQDIAFREEMLRTLEGDQT